VHAVTGIGATAVEPHTLLYVEPACGRRSTWYPTGLPPVTAAALHDSWNVPVPVSVGWPGAVSAPVAALPLPVPNADQEANALDPTATTVATSATTRPTRFTASPPRR
jgi:hypothetical protein